MSAERRLSFGQGAELYDLVRPSYPARLVDDVIEFAGAHSGDAALEVGTGTGKATSLFAERGLTILALEPSPEMAEIARRRTAGLSNIRFMEIDFEAWTPDRPYKLTYSAQAWHWPDPRIRFTRAAEALEPDGVLAAFWNRVRWESSPLRGGLEALYRRHAPELRAGVGGGPMHPATVLHEERWHDWQGDPSLSTGFTLPEWRIYVWTQRYVRDDYLNLLRTHSDHLTLDPPRRETLLEAVGQAIDRIGGSLEIEYVTRLGLARLVGLSRRGG